MELIDWPRRWSTLSSSTPRLFLYSGRPSLGEVRELRVVNDLIQRYALQPHPEGGHFKETYRAEHRVPGTNRSVCTAILYLLSAGERSTLHRIDADELWHFYQGDPLRIFELQPSGEAKQTDLSASNPQHLVPAGTWFGSMPAEGSKFSLVGCTVAPGFEFEHFELGSRATLLAEFPRARVVIELLGRE